MARKQKQTDEELQEQQAVEPQAQRPAEPQPAGSQAEQPQAEQPQQLSTLQKMKRQASEGDEVPAGSLRFRDILGGDYLWALVRNQVWLIVLVVLITTAYVAVRYQCQQDAIDISQLERDLVDAKFQSLSSSSNLTRMSRQSHVLELLKANRDSLLHISKQPPYIIEVPEK